MRAALPKTYGVLTGEQITKENQNQVEQGLGFFTTFLLASLLYLTMTIISDVFRMRAERWASAGFRRS